MGASRGVLWLIGVRGELREAPLTRDRLRRLFDSSRRSRHLDPVEDSLLSRFLHHSHRRLDRMFTPVDSVTRIPLSATARDLRMLVRDTGHSRIPVEDEAGRLAGLVVFRDLTLLDSDEPIVGVVRDVIRLSSLMALDEAIAALTARQASLGAVIGSDGEWLGIVTLEDLLEPLVGRIHDEHDTLPQVGPAA